MLEEGEQMTQLEISNGIIKTLVEGLELENIEEKDLDRMLVILSVVSSVLESTRPEIREIKLKGMK